MKRFHVHVSVEDLAASVRSRSTLFGTAPADKPNRACCAPAATLPAQIEIKPAKAAACCGRE